MSNMLFLFAKFAGLKEWGVKYGRFLGKYQMQYQKHLSETCVVVFGTELNITGSTEETKVVFKLFNDRSAFRCELEKRKMIRKIDGANKFIIGVRAAYTDSMEGLDETDPLVIQIEPPQRVTWKEKVFKNFVVMPFESKNDLSDVISHDYIAGKDVHAVHSIAIQIAKCLQFLNEECKVMHGDVKARNFVSRGEGFWICCDRS